MDSNVIEWMESIDSLLFSKGTQSCFSILMGRVHRDHLQKGKNELIPSKDERFFLEHFRTFSFFVAHCPSLSRGRRKWNGENESSFLKNSLSPFTILSILPFRFLIRLSIDYFPRLILFYGDSSSFLRFQSNSSLFWYHSVWIVCVIYIVIKRLVMTHKLTLSYWIDCQSIEKVCLPWLVILSWILSPLIVITFIPLNEG